MGGTDLEPREAVERALENQMRQRDRGFERVASLALELSRVRGTRKRATPPALGWVNGFAGRD